MLRSSTRNLLLATCMIAVPSLAMAQNTAPRTPAQPNQQMQNAQPGAQPQPNQQTQSNSQMQSGVQSRQFLAAPQAGHIRAADLRAADVYTSDNKKVGDIDEILLDSRGNIVAVIVGVGGFLGIGEKNVAIPFSSLDMRDPSMTANNATGAGTTTATANRDRMATGAVPGAASDAATTDPERQRTTAQRAEETAQQQADRQRMNQSNTTTTTTAPATRTASVTTGVWKPERIILQGVTKAELEAAPEFNWDGRARPARSGNAPNAPTNNR